MDNKYLYRSSLKNKDIPRFSMMGIVSELILSKEAFHKNSDIEVFLKEIFDIEFRSYVIKSRTIIVSRLIRTIDKCTDDDYSIYRAKLLKFIESLYEIEKNKKDINKTAASRWVISK
ncbi:hypothetical protein [Lactococcus lactis]|uniref:hypothetical protein n=1 Tax=Lactococcus lactis TaxID=1358 RepID=UPI003D2F4D50